jgi:outer membrane protein insertion porin family
MRQTAIGLLLVLLLLLGSADAWAQRVQHVDTVTWSGQGELDTVRLAEVSGLAPAAPISPSIVREAIYALADLPEIRQASVQVSSVTQELASVRVVIERVTHLQQLSIEGAEQLPDDRIMRAARLLPGDEVDQEVLREAVTRIRDLYAKHGFFQSVVTLLPAPGSAADLVMVNASIRENIRARVGQVIYPGYPLLDEDGTLDGVRLSQHSGEHFDAETLDADLERVEQRLIALGYLHPSVGPYRLQPVNGRVDVVVPVTVRERVMVNVAGNRRVKTKKIIEILDFSAQRTLDELVLGSAQRRLLRHLIASGYRLATVELSATYDADVATHQVQAMVHEGPLFRTVEVSFEGNRSLDDKALQSLISPGWRLLSEPVLEQEIIDRAATLEGAFRGIGFPDSTVTYSILPQGDKPQRSTVTYHIDEGRRWWFGDAGLSGVDGLNPALQGILREALADVPGSAYRRDRLRQIRSRLSEVLGEFGYVDAEITAETESEVYWTGEVGLGGVPFKQVRVRVTFHVVPGPEVRVGEIFLSGTFRTHPKVVRREIVLSPGELYRPSAVAETRRRLFRTASFDLVRITPKSTNSEATVRDVNVHLMEGKPGSIELGIGYGEEDGIRGLVDLSYRDLFRRGHRGSIRLRAGQLRRLASLTYTLPWVGSYRANLSTRLYYEEEDLISFDRETRAAEVGIRPPMGNDVVLTVTYRLEFNRFPRLPEDQVATLAGRRRINVGSILTSMVRDTRNDFFNPTRGTVLGASYEQGAHILGSEVQFGKATAQVAGYKSLSPNTVLAAKFQTGRVRQLFESVEVPVSERFFMGGQSTVRGYALDSVGVPGETLISGVPQGGEVMILSNLELRLWGRDGFGVVLFVDAGNVWNLGSSVGAGDFRVGAGPGLHYATPVGPLRLDLGYKLDRRQGEDPYRIHFTLGRPF